jgi:hypothetical protein
MQDHKYNNFSLVHYNVRMSQIGCIYLLCQAISKYIHNSWFCGRNANNVCNRSARITMRRYEDKQ